MIVLVAAYGVWMGVRCKAPRQKFQPLEALRSLWEAKWDLGLPTLVIVVVVSGFATIVEASAIAAAYALFVELVIFRELKPFSQLPRVLLDAGTLVGSVLILLGVALGLTSWFVDAEIPTQLVDWMTTHVKSPALFLLMLNVVLLVLGSVLEIYSAIVVVAPLVAPLGRGLRHRPGPPGRGLPGQPRAGLPLPAHGTQPLPLGPALREAAALRLQEGLPVPGDHVGGGAARHLPRAPHHGRGPAVQGVGRLRLGPGHPSRSAKIAKVTAQAPTTSME